MRYLLARVHCLCLVALVSCSRETPKREGSAPVELAAPAASSVPALTGPLRIAYSDWPGWVAWQIAIEQHYFEQAGLDVSFVWLGYVASIEAFSEGKVDAVCMTNGDALVAGSSGAPSVGILLNDYSDGNDMIVARAGIPDLASLRSRRIGVEIGFVDHLLLMEALKTAGLSEADVMILNTKTHEAAALLQAGGADAIAAWQPHSGQALEDVPGSHPVFTSADVPGLIYDLLFVAPSSLQRRRADWLKVIEVWFRVVDFIADPKHRAQAVQIMAGRVGLAPEKYSKLMAGTRLLGREENRRRFRNSPGFDSVAGSSRAVDRFNVANHVYKDSVDVAPYFDDSLVNQIVTP
jgi:NitT/TauT family transport system substrate-binding protein